MTEAATLAQDILRAADVRVFDGDFSAAVAVAQTIIDSHESAVASARKAGMLEAARFCDEWLSTFGNVEINYTPARAYACDAVADLRDLMIAIEASK